MISEKLLHNLVLTHKSEYNISKQRTMAIAWSNHYLCLPSNEKSFNFNKIKSKNKFGKYAKKSSYHTVYIKRHGETDRLKKERHVGNKLVRNFLKRETKNLLNEELN